MEEGKGVREGSREGWEAVGRGGKGCGIRAVGEEGDWVEVTVSGILCFTTWQP